MLKNTRQIKYKNDTLEMIAETARRMNVSPGRSARPSAASGRT
jgi:hypothetical protein